MFDTDQSQHSTHRKLICSRCGNRGRFVQFSSYTAELVHADGTYVRLLHSEINGWECEVCGGEAKWSEVPR